ncbi:hypothetical protein ACFZB9_07935 [Kitasatospora sp. NPDC008050]|uniref:hypothetical protein n=1 Tax=Kitasatospora sp. NPDC008050 TaxID=3364021 RepID=UPI0036E90DFD
MSHPPLPRTTDPRIAWSVKAAAPPATASSPVTHWALAGADDTLQIDACAANWAELATALSDADVPLQVGDTAVLRILAKLDEPTVMVLARWIRTTGRPSPI